jgi:hypothetical protein
MPHVLELGAAGCTTRRQKNAQRLTPGKISPWIDPARMPPPEWVGGILLAAAVAADRMMFYIGTSP